MKVENDKLQLEIEIESNDRKEDIRKLVCTAKEMTDKFEREKKSLEMEIISLKKLYDTSKEDYNNLQKEMSEQHLQDMKDQGTVKAELTAQIERDRHVVSRLKHELDKERESNRTLQKDHEKFKKKTKADKKQLKQQLEQESKIKSSNLKESEMALKELEDTEKRNLDEIAKLRKNLGELESKFYQLEGELDRWRYLPGSKRAN
jgi:chromosome segregation ATPase